MPGHSITLEWCHKRQRALIWAPWIAGLGASMDSCVYDTLCAHDRWGRIINTGSMHALVASPYKSAYNAAKHGIAGELPVLPRIA